MKNRENIRTTSKTLAWIACGLISAAGIVGCTNYGGSSVPIDDDAGFSKQPEGSVDASVPIDDDAGLVKDKTPKP